MNQRVSKGGCETRRKKLETHRQALHKLKDVGGTTSFLELLLSDLLSRFDGSQQDVESNRSSVECRLLRDETDLFSL